ncbi:BACON domain-containing protein [Bacteroides nordii]|jgi:hypothetical protein|uniref:BACON domain-containing protein n=1 Tax=Bacteroides nordii TaxID=291645 RepID=UPI0018A9DFCF|nr:BACON domain-containing protein [Bacteroides nordii]
MATLLERAERIRDETGIMHNTNMRVGSVLVDIIKQCEDKGQRIEVLEKTVEDLCGIVDDMQLSVSPTKIDFPTMGGTQTVRIRALIDWVIT